MDSERCSNYWDEAHQETFRKSCGCWMKLAPSTFARTMAARTACLSSPSHQIAAPYGVKVSFRLIHYLITGTLKKNAGPKGPANLDREPERRGGRWEGGVLSTTNSVSYSSEPVTELG